MKVSEVCDYKNDDILKNLLRSQPEKTLPAQHTFSTTAIIGWDAFDAFDALAWYQTFTELYNELKVDLLSGSFYLHKTVLPLEDIELQYLQGHDDNNEDIYESSQTKFFQEMPKLLDQYEGKFVAFVNDEMEIDDDEESLVLKIIQKHGNVSFYLDKVTLEENEIPIMSTKIAV